MVSSQFSCPVWGDGAMRSLLICVWCVAAPVRCLWEPFVGSFRSPPFAQAAPAGSSSSSSSITHYAIKPAHAVPLENASGVCNTPVVCFCSFVFASCNVRFETAPPRQGAGECRMAAKIWVWQCRVLHGGSLEVARLGLGWNPLMGRKLGPSADEQRARLCARARASCQWRQLANYTGRLLPIADVGHP